MGATPSHIFDFEGGNLNGWIEAIESADSEDENRLQLAFQHMSNEVRDTIQTLEDFLRLIKEGKFKWSWQLFSIVMRGIQDQVDEKRKKIIKVCVTTAGIAGSCILAPMVLTAVVGAAGFGAGGVVGGTLASSIHSAIGVVRAGSLFSICQSLGAGGYAFAAAQIAATSATYTTLLAGSSIATAIASKKEPSTSWNDGERFVPSGQLLETILTAMK